MPKTSLISHSDSQATSQVHNNRPTTPALKDSEPQGTGRLLRSRMRMAKNIKQAWRL